MRHVPAATPGAGPARPATVADAALQPSARLAGPAADPIDEARARRQLGVIATMTTDFVRAGIVHWLIGGWAVDFHLGRVSRNHADIDVALWITDRDLATRVLTRRELRPDLSRSHAGIERFVGPAEHVDVTYLALSADGSVVTPGLEHWPYQPRSGPTAGRASSGPTAGRAGSFGDEQRSLWGVRSPVPSAASLLETKRRWEHEVGDPPRPHDLADIDALRSLATTGRRPPRHQPTTPATVHHRHHEDQPCT